VGRPSHYPEEFRRAAVRLGLTTDKTSTEGRQSAPGGGSRCRESNVVGAASAGRMGTGNRVVRGPRVPFVVLVAEFLVLETP
jgi:hypothetical protein